MAKRKADTETADALEILAEDHQNVLKLTRKYKRAKDADEKQEIVKTVCAELKIHAAIEEEIFYPAVRESVELDELLNEAEVEHEVARDLIEELSGMSSDDELFDAKFHVLCEYVLHHIDEEEQRIFPKTRRKLDLESLGEQLLKRKEELTHEESEEALEEA